MDAHDQTHAVTRSLRRLRSRRIANVFQVLLLCVLLTSGLPTLHPAQDALRETLDSVVDAVGLWQSQWELFAPEPDKVNVRVVAFVEFADGVTGGWKSPDWQTLSGAARFRHFRLAEFVDGIRLDSHRGAWPAFARWVAREVQHPDGGAAPPVRVTLWRYWVVIPEPRSPLSKLSDPLPMQLQDEFHVQELTP